MKNKTAWMVAKSELLKAQAEQDAATDENGAFLSGVEYAWRQVVKIRPAWADEGPMFADLLRRKSESHVKGSKRHPHPEDAGWFMGAAHGFSEAARLTDLGLLP